MNKVLFYDLKNDGHHFFYNYHALRGIKNSEKYYYTGNDISKKQMETLYAENVKIFTIDDNKCLNRVARLFSGISQLRILRKKVNDLEINILCLLHLDSIILPLYFVQLVTPIKCKIVSTLHWKSNKKIKNLMLKRLCNKGLKLVVHTEDVKKSLEYIGIKNIVQIDYPMLQNMNLTKKEAIRKLNIIFENEYKTILYFGGTRTDKGIDILLDALAKCRSKLNIIIAGQEQSFTRRFIVDKLKKLPYKNIKLDLKYINDKDVEAYFKASDIVVLPYRKVFGGESGILTEAINNKNVIIVPNIVHFPGVVSLYNNGSVYEAENIDDLAKKIDYTVENISEFYVGVENAHKYSIEKRATIVFSNKFNKIISE